MTWLYMAPCSLMLGFLLRPFPPPPLYHTLPSFPLYTLCSAGAADSCCYYR